MGEKRLNNTIYLMFYVTELYRNKNNLTNEQFNKLSYKNELINYIATCPEVFDSLNDEEIIEEVNDYIGTY